MALNKVCLHLAIHIEHYKEGRKTNTIERGSNYTCIYNHIHVQIQQLGWLKKIENLHRSIIINSQLLVVHVHVVIIVCAYIEGYTFIP